MHDSDAFFDRRLEDSFNAGFTMSSSAPLNVRSCCHSAPSSGFGKSRFLRLTLPNAVHFMGGMPPNTSSGVALTPDDRFVAWFVEHTPEAIS
jgi:hypothetical protein